jgi:DNA-binding IclR family transcriptional regulator
LKETKKSGSKAGAEAESKTVVPGAEGVPRYATPALEKGLDVLELLARQPGGLTKSQVARELDRTVSEIFRMLVCLEERGYIAQVEEEKYALTLKLFKLVQEHPPTERLLTESLPVLQRVAHDTMQSCHLGVLESGRVAILAQVNAPTNIGFYVKLGSTVDMMDAASGYVILAHQTAAQRERLLATWRKDTGRKPPRDMQEHLKRIRAAGFDQRASYVVKGVVDISYPVFDQYGAALGALTIPYIEHMGAGMGRGKVAEVLRAAAAEITGQLGGVVSSRE